MDSRWKLTFAFGLVHGFGFAGALQDLGIGGRSLDIARALGPALASYATRQKEAALA